MEPAKDIKLISQLGSPIIPIWRYKIPSELLRDGINIYTGELRNFQPTILLETDTIMAVVTVEC